MDAMNRLGVSFSGGVYKLADGSSFKSFDEAMVTAVNCPFDPDAEKKAKAEREKAIAERERAIAAIPVVSVSVLPPNARYKLIDLISFQSTLGTGFFSEFGSDISNIFGTEANMMNTKMSKSMSKCKAAMRTLAYDLGANAVIGVDFDFSTNTRDATTVAAQGTAVFIENIDEVFQK